MICRLGRDYLQGTSPAFGAEKQLRPRHLLLQPGLCGGCEDLQGHRDQAAEDQGRGFVVSGKSPFQTENGLLGSGLKCSPMF